LIVAATASSSTLGEIAREWWRKMVSMQLPSRVDQPVWTRTLIGWHVVFYALLGVIALVGLTSSDLQGHRRIAYLGLVTVR
jgi:cytochrome b561